MLRYLFFLLALLLLAFGCTPRPALAEAPVQEPTAHQPTDYERLIVDDVRRPASFEFPRPNKDWQNYQPDPANIRLLPYRYVQVNLHIMNTTDTFYRFYGEEAQDYLLRMMDQTFTLLHNTPEMWLPPDSMDVPALRRHMALRLTKKPDGTPAIYEHYDDERYWYLHKGPQMNRSSREVIDKYAINVDSVLNIFIMGPPREKVAAGFRAGTDGIYLGGAIKITGLLSGNRMPWHFKGLIVHEAAHGLGLYHAWTKRDGCDDTRVHKNNAWSKTGEESGPGKTSNNLMDYSNRQESLTPCQIGRMHARMSDITGRQRRWLERFWCTYDPQKPIWFKTDYDLNGSRDYNSDLFVKRGVTLRINARVHLPDGAAIHVEPGGRLEIGPQAIIHSDCGGRWAGIRVKTPSGGERGAVTVDPQAVFLNERP